MSFFFNFIVFTSLAHAQQINYDSPLHIKAKGLGRESSDIMAYYFKDPIKKVDPSFVLLRNVKQQQLVLKKINGSKAVLLFSNELNQTGLTLESKDEASLQIKQELSKQKLKIAADYSIIILNKSANEYAFLHELQHAEDFRNKIKDALRTSVLKALKIEDGYLPDDMTLAFLEWRGYSRQILELEAAKKNDEIQHLLSVYSQARYHQRLSEFYEAVKAQYPKSAADMCLVYKKFFISNKYLTLESVSVDCKTKDSK